MYARARNSEVFFNRENWITFIIITDISTHSQFSEDEHDE
jgi:hypothetical protein